MLFCFAACTENVIKETETAVPVTTGTTETVTGAETEAEKTPEVTVPEYKDIGLSGFLSGTDNRKTIEYKFSEYKYGALRSDSNLVFTSNKDYTVDKNGLTITDEGWNSVGFSYTLTEPYTAKAFVINRGAVNNVRTIMFGARITRSDHLYIDSGLWFTFSGSSVFATVKNGFTCLVGDNFDFDAKDGLDLTITDDGSEIVCYVKETRVASAVVGEENLVLYDKDGAEVAHTPDLARIAHGDTLGYVRTMSHFANSSTRSMSLQTGKYAPYSPDDTVTELREGYGYLLCDKTMFRTAYPITMLEGVTYIDAAAAADLFGFDCNVSGDTVTLTRDDAALTYKAGAASVDLNGTAHDCPTTVSRGGTLLLAADYLARWLGYAVTTADSSIYISGSSPTEERIKEMNDRYKLYNDVVFNYDDVEIEKTGVGKYEKTNYEDRLVGIAYSTWL